MNNENKEKILEILSKTYSAAKCGLNYNSPYELLIATILSAQCTDERVNIVVGELFKIYNTPQKMITLSQDELVKKIKSCGLYKNKSKNILSASKVIIDDYKGKVPNNMKELMKLSGVGRKTANVVLANAFGIPTIAVDTHVFRVANRIGLANSNNVYEVEKQLMNNIPKKMWSDAHHFIIWHGRKICKARKPNCVECPIKNYCDYCIKETNCEAKLRSLFR